MPNYHLGPTNPICYPVGVAPPASTPAFRLYPNPTSGKLTIEFAESGILEIADVTGRRLKTVPLNNTQSGKTVIDLSELPAGAYICKYLVNGLLRETHKIILAHE